MQEIYKYGIVIISSLFAAFGSYSIKLTAKGSKGFRGALKSPYLYIGGFLYTVSTALYIKSMQLLGLPVAASLASLTYIWALIIAKVFLHECISMLKIIGASLIISGAIMVYLFK